MRGFYLCGVAIVLALISSDAIALPYFDTDFDQCDEGPAARNWPDTDEDGDPLALSGYDPGNVIYVYIEENFGREAKDCADNEPSNSSPLIDLNNTQADEQAINAIVGAMDVWNRSSRTALLKYAGTVAGNIDAYGVCSGITKPAVVVSFSARCKGEGTSCDSTTALASTTKQYINTCDNSVEIRVWGDPDSPTGCTSGSSGSGAPRDWYLEPVSGELDLVSLMVHEFGHVLDLPDEIASYGSVMDNGNTDNFWRRRHLYPWDKDCSDDTVSNSHRGVRKVAEYRYQGFTSSGSEYGSIQTPAADTVRSFLSGGYLREGSDDYYGMFYGDHLRTTSVGGADGSFTYSAESSFASGEFDDELFNDPVLMSPLEKSGTNQDHRITFNKTFNGTTNFYDPPYVRYIRSDDYFASDTTSYDYKECDTSSCTSPTSIRSHVPMVSAWDPVESTTIFVSVNTPRSSSDFGEIKIHAGFNGADDQDILTGEYVSSNAPSAPSTGYTGISFNMTTDVAPAITCAPDRNDFDHNCLIAWVDNGVSDGAVLYSFFNLDSSGNISWDSYTAKHTSADTVSGISAAYFGGKMWLAWTTIDGDVKYSYSTEDYVWSGGVSIGATKAISAPTWLYRPDASEEAALVWMEHDDV